MIALLIAPWLLLQGAKPELKASVDREHLSLGDDLVYSVQAISRSTAPLRILVPTISGFEIIGRSERSSVSHFGGSSRSTTLELRLRALKPGKWAIGPARAVQGGEEVVAPAVTVRVDDLPGATAVAANPALRALLERAPPPPAAGQPAVSLALSSHRGAVGDQIDVLTAAWFPRELRVRLRRPPTLQPPVIEGVWSYPQPVPPGIAATRTVGGTLYDLFVAHQIAFPLRPGRIVVTPAVLKYSVPLALQFFSQEERYTLASAPETLSVVATPIDGRPAGYAGAVGRALRLVRTVEPPTAVPGEPVSVAFELSGEGNPALWPAPELTWPEGVRSYPDGTDERLQVTQGRLGGTKTFRFTVVPDSSGTLALPGAQYAYYDVGEAGFRMATLAGDRLVVAAGSEAKASRPPPPPPQPMRGAPWPCRVRGALPDWAWSAFGLVPPLALLGRRLRARRRPSRPATRAPDVATLENEVEALVRTLAPNADALGEGGLVAALRAAGLDPEPAARLVRLRDRLRELRYGPLAGSVPPDLAADARLLLDLFRPQAGGRWGAIAAAAALAVGALGAGITPVQAQASDPVRLYVAGSLHAAASGFLRQLDQNPQDPATWYNLGATYYRLGLDGRAAAAWLQAHRLAPRNRTVNRALDLVPPPESGSATRIWMPPISWPELGMIALPVWALGWALLAWRPRRRDLGVALVLLGVLTGAAAFALRARERRPVAIVLSLTPLQLSPHERAPTITPLEPGTAVMLLRRQAGWSMVNAPGGATRLVAQRLDVSAPEPLNMARRIAILPDAVADQIAAGEVVERPASVVKELVENALDAGASRVQVRLENGGKSLVEVSDDGCGMGREDAVLALDRHATSKIRSAADLVGVATFGFRGEALPAIASVSRLALLTAEADGEGTSLAVTGGRLDRVETAARRRGTTVTVRNLFFNTPARRKFLRSTASEARAAHDALATLALAHPDRGFELEVDGTSRLLVPPDQTRDERLAGVWGRELAVTLIPVAYAVGGFRIDGLIQRPADAAPTGRRTQLFVNGRPFRDPFLVRAAEAGYRAAIHPGDRPSLFLSIAVAPSEVDVNVHPAKLEVRFRERVGVERAIEEAVRDALGALMAAARIGDGRMGGWSDGPGETNQAPVPAAAEPSLPIESSGQASMAEAFSPPLLQLFDTYIVYQSADGAVIVDQHSAHERVIYEAAIAELSSGRAASQQLLLPLTIELTDEELEAVETYAAELRGVGFEVDAFGGRAVAIHAVPAPHPRFDAAACFREMIADLARGRFGGWANRLERFAATYACRAAVKAGQPLSEPEMRRLLLRLFETDLPPHDVHGRSTIVQLPRDELERRFGRR